MRRWLVPLVVCACAPPLEVDLTLAPHEPIIVDVAQLPTTVFRFDVTNPCARPVVRVAGERVAAAALGGDGAILVPTGGAFSEAIARAGIDLGACGVVNDLALELDCTGQVPLVGRWGGPAPRYADAIETTHVHVTVYSDTGRFGPEGTSSPIAATYVRAPRATADPSDEQYFTTDPPMPLRRIRAGSEGRSWLVREPVRPLPFGTVVRARIILEDDGDRPFGHDCFGANERTFEWSWTVRDVPGELAVSFERVSETEGLARWEDLGRPGEWLTARLRDDDPQERVVDGAVRAGTTVAIDGRAWCVDVRVPGVTTANFLGTACVEAL